MKLAVERREFMPEYETEAQAIQNLRTYLRQLSYHDKNITAPPID
jgi:hypothetical protein